MLHCFSLPEHLDEAVERGWYVSFAGNVTYPAATGLQEAARRVPAELLLLETDCPYLSPVPHRGRPTGPSTCSTRCASSRSCATTEAAALGAQVEANAVRAFALPDA